MSVSLSREQRLAAARTLLQAGRAADAGELAASLVGEDVDDADAWLLLAKARLAHGAAAEALEGIDRALALEPARADLLAHRAAALVRLRRFEEAIECAGAAAAAGGRSAAVAWNARGLAELELGLSAAAADSFRRALERAPAMVSARNNLGHALRALGRPADAAVEYRRAIAADPRVPDLHDHLGVALLSLGRTSEAVLSFAAALKLDPTRRSAWRNLGNARVLQGRPEDAVRCYEKALSLGTDAACFSNALHARLYLPGQTRASIRAAHEAYGRRFGGVPARGGLRPAGRRPLRVGFVPADFARHPVGYLSLGVFEAFDRERLRPILYSSTPERDAFTRRFEVAAEEFRDVRSMSDEELAATIAGDDLDALVDLSGHTAGNRLGVFARRPAPRTATWVGYPSTTGMPGVDWFLSDARLCPEGADDEFTEQVVRLDAAAVTFVPPREAPAVGERDPGPIRIGAFHHPAKLSAVTLDRLGGVMRALPDATLLLQYKGLDDRDTRARIAAELGERGVDPTRVAFRGFAPLRDALRAFASVDLAIDAAPFSGGLTTLMLLWMGVPVVARPGETLASRQSAAYLGHLGLDELVATDESDLVARAEALARDARRLRELRFGLRERMRRSPLLDARRTARALEAVLATG